MKSVVYDTDEAAYVQLQAKPNFSLVGRRLGRRVGELARELKGLSREALREFEEHGEIELLGEMFSGDEIQVFREPVPETGAQSDRLITVALDCTLDDALRSEGKAREIVNRVQRARKALDLAVTDRIHITYEGDAALQDCVENFRDYIAGETLALQITAGELGENGVSAEIEDASLRFSIEKVAQDRA